jgi:DNA polymerase-3 subunit beta
MHSTDLEISLITETEVDCDETGAVAIPAKKLSEIVRELPNQPLTVKIEDEHRIILQGQTGIYQIAGSDPDDFPAVPDAEGGEEIVLTGEKLKRMINHTSFAVSKDDMRPSLCGIYFQALEEDIRTVATDGHRLSKILDKSLSTGKKVFEAIVPVKALSLATKNVADDDEIHIAMSGNYLTIKMKGDILYSRLIEGRYPQYESVIPKSNTKTLVSNVEALSSAVRRVAIFSNYITKQVKFSIAESKMVISAEDSDTGGEAEEELVVDYQGEDIIIGFNSSYIMDALRQIDSEDVKFSIGTSDSAAIIEPLEQRESEEFLMLLMPVRLT